MQLSELELSEIENFTNAAPRKFTGLIMDESAKGRANAQSIASYLDGRAQQFTVKHLDEAVIALQFVLFWTAGNEPVTVPSDTRTRAQKAADGGITPYQPTVYVDAANGIESSWAKDIRLGKEANAARLAAKAKADLRFRETNQIVQGPNGRVSYAQSEALNKAAAQRHAEEDSRESGKPVAAAKAFRIIPAGTTDFLKYSAEEIKVYLAKQKGGHLLR